MANQLDSNTNVPLAKSFLKSYESNRVISKAVDTQVISGKHNASTGDTVEVKRPTDYNTIRTSGGDISSSTKSDIITGKAHGTVQGYFTVATEWANVEEALELDQLDQLLAPMAKRMATDIDLDFGHYMIKNSGLKYGTPGSVVDAWSDVAGAGALMSSSGIPQDSDWFYVMNPFTTTALANTTTGVAGIPSETAKTAWEKAQISRDFGGMKPMTSSSMKSFTSGDASDRAGTLSATPTGTYVAHKDSMIQSLAVTAFSANATVKAGEIIQVTGRNRLSLATREPILDAAGNAVLWTGTVTADVTLGASGEGVLLVTGPAINEANGQYNTVDSALASGDVVTLLGSASTLYQPNMFFHKEAFSIATIKLPKLYSTDTVFQSADGMSMRVSRYADGDSNTQKVRFDILPAYATLNPFFAGQGYGS